MFEEPKDIKVIEGDGSNLEISPVYDHINNIQQPRKKQKQEIVIPKVKNNKKEIEKIDNEEQNETEDIALIDEETENTPE